MGRLVLLMCACVLAAPAMAQGSGEAAKVRSASNFIDLSKDLPVGKSRFAVNADGSAADVGAVAVKAAPAPEVSPDADEREVPRWARPGAAAEAKARCEANPGAPECRSRSGSRAIVVVPGKEKQAAASRPRIRFGRRR